MNTPTPTAPVRRRGITVPGHPQVLGSLIGAVGASTFVWANAPALPEFGHRAALAVWAVSIAVFALRVLLLPRVMPDLPRPAPHAGAIYGASCVAMVAAIALGRAALSSAGQERLAPALIALAVGLHFLPFAAAFHAPAFLTIGGCVAALGAAGLVLGFTVGTAWASAAAVSAGVAMLLIMAVTTQEGPEQG